MDQNPDIALGIEEYRDRQVCTQAEAWDGGGLCELGCCKSLELQVEARTRVPKVLDKRSHQGGKMTGSVRIRQEPMFLPRSLRGCASSRGTVDAISQWRRHLVTLVHQRVSHKWTGLAAQ